MPSVIPSTFPRASKGTYRRHLSKMHFVKDAAGGSATPTLKASPGGPSSASASVTKGSSSGAANAAFKFFKYTELAKQLFSTYV